MTAQQIRIAAARELGYTHVSGIAGRNTVTMVKHTAEGRNTVFIQPTGHQYTSGPDGR